MTDKHPYTYMECQNISDLLKCSLCRHPFVDPVKTADEKLWCRSCLDQASSSDLTSVTPVTEPIILEMVNSLLVRCAKCEEENIRRDCLAKHKNENCKRANVPCKAADIKCSWTGIREALDGHLQQCVFEPLRPALSEIFKEIRLLEGKITQLENSIQTPQLMNNLSFN